MRSPSLSGPIGRSSQRWAEAGAGVGVAVGVGVGVMVGVREGVGVLLGVGVGDGVHVGVGVAVGVKVGVAVGVGVDVPSIGGWAVIGEPTTANSTTRATTSARAAMLAPLVPIPSPAIRKKPSLSRTKVYIAGQTHNVHLLRTKSRSARVTRRSAL